MTGGGVGRTPLDWRRALDRGAYPDVAPDRDWGSSNMIEPAADAAGA
jgi:hypothetical protein